MGDGFGAFLRAVWRYWLLLMSGIVGIAITFWEKVGERPVLASGLYALSLVCVFVACYLAWKRERAEVTRLTREVEAKPAGAKLRLGFDSEDRLCVDNHGGDLFFRVQVFNDGDERARDVRVVLDDMEPPRPAVHGEPFKVMKGSATSYDVSPSGNRAPVYVDVLMQRHTSSQGFVQNVLAPGAGWLTQTKRIRLVLRIQADRRANPFELVFESGASGNMQPVKWGELPRENDV